MTALLARQAGSALAWRASQLASVKIIYFARLLILARLLAPDDFGLFAMAVITLDLLLRLTDTGAVPALVQKPATRASDYDVAWTIGLLRATLVTAAMIGAAPLCASLFDEPRAANMIRLLAIVAFLEGTMSIRVADLHRDLRFRELAIVSLSETIVNAVVAIALAPLLGVWALGIAPIVAATVQSVVSYAVAPYRPRLSFERDAFSHLFVFGRWIFLSGLIAVVGGSLLQVVIARQLGAAELGLYFLAMKLAFLPSNISSEVVGAVAFPVFARLQYDPAQVRRVIRSILLALAAIIGPATLLLMIVAPMLVQHVLGPRWSGTEELIVILASVNVIGMTGDVVVPVLKGLGLPASTVVTGTTQYTLLVSIGWFLTAVLGVRGAALAWLPAVAITQVVAMVLLRRRIERPFASTGRPLAAILIVTIISAVLARIASQAWPSQTGVVAALAIGGVATMVGLWLVDRRSGLHLGSELRALFPQIAAFGR